MKRIVVTIAFVFSFLCAQAADVTAISNALKAGNANALTAWMDKEVDMAVAGAAKKCSGADAVAMLTAFFGSNKPGGFVVVHQADKKENGFFVGKLPTAAKEYRVNISYRIENDKAIIQSIRIE